MWLLFNVEEQIKKKKINKNNFTDEDSIMIDEQIDKSIIKIFEVNYDCAQ